VDRFPGICGTPRRAAQGYLAINHLGGENPSLCFILIYLFE
jgi:hypothetical protein